MTTRSRGNAPRVVVVGSINLDLVLRVPRIVSPGETLSGSELQEIPGGKGANQAVAAARLGASVSMVGRVGTDSYGQQLLQALQDANVDTSHVNRSTGSSGLAWIQVDDQGENSIVILPGANGQLTSRDVEQAEELIKQADVVLLQLEIPIPTIIATIELAHRHSVNVQLDPAPVADDLPLPWSKIDLLCPNETELVRLTRSLTSSSDATPATRAAALLDLGVSNVIVSQGPLGASHYSRQGESHRDAFPIQAVDTTAAGDTFRAALAVAMAEGQSINDAMTFANAAGALAATVHGAQPSLPTRQAIELFLSSRRSV